MIQNMGKIDRIIRLAIAIIIAVLYFTKLISGILAIILGIFSIILIITSIIGFCPLYVPLKIDTKEKK